MLQAFTYEPIATAAAAPKRVRLRAWMVALLAVLAALAIAVPAFLIVRAPRQGIPTEVAAKLAAPKRVVPMAELPPVEPVRVAELTPDTARAINAAIPFSALPNPAARAFRIFGADADRARAVDCLAAAAYYEAGDDAVGERAVAQVVINRVRHPAFPKSICGVVFQGSERGTGCQFTFTCDGALARRPSEAAWRRAQEIARLALAGSVYKPVGHATHYHTDWVVPYWSSSLEKITEVHTHLFFRWTGWWGTPGAFNRGYAGAEPNIPLLAPISSAHSGGSADGLPEGAVETTLNGVTIVDPASLGNIRTPAPSQYDANTFLVTLDKKMSPDAYAALAIRTCGERSYCKFMGWTDAKLKPATPIFTAAQLEGMSFSYLRDQTSGFAKALWNCREFKRPSPVQCMLRQQLGPRAASVSAPPAAKTEAGRATLTLPASVPTLNGVRRRGEPTIAAQAPAPTPSPSPSPTPRPTPVAAPTAAPRT